MPDPTIHSCLLFAEEFLNLAQTRKTDENFEFRVKSDDIQPASVEFLGRELSPEERSQFNWMLSGAHISIADLAKTSTAFIVGHITWNLLTKGRD